MLDTNAVSHLIRGNRKLTARVARTSLTQLAISTVTEGELRFGLALRPESTRLHAVVGEFLRAVQSLPWDSAVALTYGALRAQLQKSGRMLAPLDLLITAHAMTLEATLITNDGAIRQVQGLKSEDWST